MLKRFPLRPFLSSGLAYGLGLVLGSALQLIIVNYVSFAPRRDQEAGVSFLLLSVLLAFLIAALGRRNWWIHRRPVAACCRWANGALGICLAGRY